MSRLLLLLGPLIAVSLPGAPALAGTPPPLELKLVMALPGVHAMLVNRSTHAQPYLHHGLIQPCQLLLRDAAGKQHKPRDTRDSKEYDATVTRKMYRTLKPGKQAALVSAAFQSTEQGFELRWGPYLFQGLRPGRYQATATLPSQRDRWLDRASGKRGKVSGLWRGRLVSAAVSFDLVAPRHVSQLKPTSRPARLTYRGDSRTRLYHHPTCQHSRCCRFKRPVKLRGLKQARAGGYSPCKTCRPHGRYLRRVLGPPPRQPRQPRGRDRRCKVAADCVFSPPSPCSCSPCAYWWREAINRAAARRLRGMYGIMTCARRACPPCQEQLRGAPGLALGRKLACTGGQCTVRP